MKLLAQGELMFRSEILETDYGDLPGSHRFRNEVQNVEHRENFWQLLSGYEYQHDQVAEMHRHEQLQSIEHQYQGQSGHTRYADGLSTDGATYYEFKGLAANYNPSNEVKQRFASQAADYAASGRIVVYIFSNNPPQWIVDILNARHIQWQVRPG